MCGQSWVTRHQEHLRGTDSRDLPCCLFEKLQFYFNLETPNFHRWVRLQGGVCGEEAALGKELLSSGLQNPQLYNSSVLANILGCATSHRESAWPPGVSILLSHHICTALPSLTTAPHQTLNILTFWTIQVDFPFDFNKSKCSLSPPPSLLAVEEDIGLDGFRSYSTMSDGQRWLCVLSYYVSGHDLPIILQIFTAATYWKLNLAMPLPV